MRGRWKAIALLILPGVILSAVLVTLLTHFVAGLTLPIALLLGSILSATDPVAVIAVFRRIRIPRALATIIESEALLNDAIAVVLYRAVLLSMAVSVSTTAVATIAWQALLGSVFAISLGIIGGLLFGQVLRLRGNIIAQTIVTFVAAYLVYFIADRLGWSGIFSVIACAITMRECDRQSSASSLDEEVERIWNFAAVLANIALFFLIGATVEPLHLLGEWRIILATLLGVAVARIILAYGLLALVPRLEWSWKIVIQFAGVRGALGLALALALPSYIIARNTVIDATFAVVIITIITSALTAEHRIGRLELD